MATTKITKGKSFLRAAKYDLENGLNKEDREKIAELPETKAEAIAPGFKKGERARLLGTNLIEGDVSDLAKQFEEVAAQQPGIKEPVHKVSISIKPGEHLATYQWLEVGKSYLKEMGYEDSPFLIAQHREKDHEHIHLLTSRVDFNGKVVSDAFEQKKARKWAKGVEEKYNLIKTPEKSSEKGLSRVEIEQSMKTGKIPPKLVLQETIKKTLEAYQETPDFIEALHKQNVSVAVRQKEKEIIGISFAYDGRAFKGSDLGANFTWKGLQERGLNYEFERDYKKLEEASLRASRTKSESAGSKLPNTDGIEQSADSITESNGLDNRIEIGAAGFDKFSRKRRSRGENEGTPIEELGTRITAGRKLSEIESISESTETDERFFENGSAENSVGSQTEFRRSGRFDSDQIKTSGRFEQKIGEPAITSETYSETNSGQNFAGESIPEIEFYKTSREFEQLSEFPGNAGLFTANELSFENPSAGANIIAGAGAGITAFDQNWGISNGNVPLDDLGGREILPGTMDIDQGSVLAGSSDAGSVLRISDTDFIHFSSNSGDQGNSASGQSDYLEKEVKADYAERLRQSLDYAETVGKKTIEIDEDLEKEEIKKAEIKEKRIELEMDLEIGGRGMSM